MTDETTFGDDTTHSTSTGHAHSAGDWLDAHFAACRAEYEAMVGAVGIAPGWRVLDAGCGSGDFLPALAARVGPTGQLAAIDLAPENIAAIDARLAAQALSCPVATQVGSLLALPYPDDHFDAAWCANTSQYLTGEELARALAELCRVVRPGGIVALKEFDAGLWYLSSREPHLFTHFLAQAGRDRLDADRPAPELRGWLSRAGLTDVQLRATMIERQAPYAPDDRRYLTESITFFAGLATRFNLSAPEQTEWAQIAALGERFCDDPTYGYYREGAVLATGRVAPRA